MQDLHDYSTTECDGGGGGSTVRFFGGGIGSGDRRMREHKNNILDHHQSLKCPRCNSLNTKFCYYNNYNLSQPRHFCKNCRRYWTKGGVLRNVPVGGGCRKAKRSRNKQPPPISSPFPTDKPTSQDVEEKSSSSESSSLTASNSTVADVSVSATATVVAGSEVASSVIPGFPGTDIPNLKLHGNGIEWSTLLGQGSSDGGVFLEIGGFTAASSIETTPFEFGDNSVHQDDHMKLEGETIQQQFEDRMAQVEFPGSSLDPNMGFEPLDWGSGASDGGDRTLFDLTSTGDHAYWSQSQWTSTSDQDQNGFYLP